MTAGGLSWCRLHPGRLAETTPEGGPVGCELCAPLLPLPPPPEPTGAPPGAVVVICGSTRFMAQLELAARRETMAGRIVVRPECDLRRADTGWPASQLRAEVQARLDAVQRAKVRLADEVLVVAPGGYVGPSTQAAVDYAAELGVAVRYWRPSATRQAPGVPAGVVSALWWWLVCEVCGASSLDEEDGPGLFGTPREAAGVCVADWSVFEGISRCPACAAQCCAAVGHAWSPWRESRVFVHVGRVVDRHCQRCGQHQEHQSPDPPRDWS